MKIKINPFLLVLLCCVSGLPVLQASSSTGAQFLQVISSPRIDAMGGSYTALDNEAENLFFNPAGMTGITYGMLAGGYRNNTLFGIHEGRAAYITPTSFGHLGIGAVFLGIPLTNPWSSGAPAGKDDSLLDIAAGAGLQVSLFKERLSLGLGAKFIMEDLSSKQPVSAAFDIGAIFRIMNLPNFAWNFGIAGRNIGPDIKADLSGSPAPVILSAGTSALLFDSLRLLADISSEKDRKPVMHFGTEYSFKGMFMVRGGLILSETTTWALGLGIYPFHGPVILGVDYSYDDVNPMSMAHNISLHAGSSALNLLQAEIKISAGDILMEPAFAALYKYYTRNVLGSFSLVNDAPVEIRNIKISFFVKDLMDFPTECGNLEKLGPNEKVEVPIFADFNNKVLDITEDTPKQGELIIEAYDSRNRKSEERRTVPFQLLNRNAMTWDVTGKLASFITPKDTAVKVFAREVIRRYYDTEKKTYLNENILKALHLFDALGATGLSYVSDPNTPFSKYSTTKDQVDFIQYPRDTLRFRTGDCDDCTVLFCALLENVGVPTALVTTPGHIFMMFDTGVAWEEANLIQNNQDMMIQRNGTVWVPVETTMYGQNFYRAWQMAVREIKEGGQAAEFIDTSSAWQDYVPVTLNETGWEPKIPDKQSIDILTSKDYIYCSDNKISEQINATKAEILKNPDNFKAINKLGLVYVKMGLVEEAEKQFISALQKNPEYKGAAHNLGNIYRIQEDWDNAEKWYRRAVQITPEDARAHIDLALVLFQKGDKRLAHAEYLKAFGLDPKVKEKYSYLEKEEDTSGTKKPGK